MLLAVIVSVVFIFFPEARLLGVLVVTPVSALATYYLRTKRGDR